MSLKLVIVKVHSLGNTGISFDQVWTYQLTWCGRIQQNYKYLEIPHSKHLCSKC